MSVRDELVLAAVYEYPIKGTLEERRAAAAEIVRVHRTAPLVEHAEQLHVAADALPVLEAAVDERVAELEQQLRWARRAATLAWARVAVLEAAHAA